jgi:hypothetical protein
MPCDILTSVLISIAIAPTHWERSFDLHDALTNPRKGIVASLKYALTGMGHSCRADFELEKFIGPPEGQWKTNIKTNLVTRPSGPREK